MHVSIFLGPFSAGPHEDKPLIDLCVEQALDAAKAGFCMVTFGEQHFNGYEPYCNPFMLGAYLSRELGDTWFGTTICPLPLHSPLRLAENIAVLDLLHGGRVVIGLSAGRGVPFPDFENFGMDPREREAIFEDKLNALLAIFAHRPGDPPVVLDSKWDRGRMVGRLMPMPSRTPHPQLAIGTSTDATIVATAARGWPIFLGPCFAAEAGEKFARYREALAVHPADVQADCLAKSMTTRNVIVGRTKDEAWARAERMHADNDLLRQATRGRSFREFVEEVRSGSYVAPHPGLRALAPLLASVVCGTPEEVAASLLELDTLGVPHVNTRFTVGTYRPEDMRASYRLFADEVLPALRPQAFAALPTSALRA